MGQSANNSHLVFTYGTLKKGQPNEYKMGTLPSVRFVAEAVTVKPFPLVVGSPWYLPLLLDLSPQGKIVQGEVYEVNGEGLEILDNFEGHPDMYQRKYIDVIVTKSSDTDDVAMDTTLTCWVYFYVSYTDDDLTSEHLESYDDASIDRKYDIRENPEHPDNMADT